MKCNDWNRCCEWGNLVSIVKRNNEKIHTEIGFKNDYVKMLGQKQDLITTKARQYVINTGGK